MRPLDPLSSIKTKLGVVIVAAVSTTVLVVILGVRAGFPVLACGAVAGLLALGMVQFLARGMTSPLREMAAAASSMARGDYGRRVTATSRDEVGDLARAFNAMAADLAEAERSRRDLVANVSHELRTPISALQALLENLVDGVEPPDPRSLHAALGQVQRLGALVEQLLALSRLEAGVAPPHKETFAVEGLFEQAVHEARMRAQRDGRGDVTIAASVEPRALEFHADAERAHQVVANLLHNAISHSPINGEVALSARTSPSGIEVAVSDEGPGIPDEEVARVFERFYRTDAARSSVDGGTGLGLAIVKWIVDEHGGTLAIERNHPRGARVVVTFPQVGEPAVRDAL